MSTLAHVWVCAPPSQAASPLDEERDTLVRLIEEHGRKFIIIAPIMKRKADDVRNMTKQNKSLQKLLEDAGLGANKRGSYKKRKG